MRALETDRLTLRWFAKRDAAFILELVNDPSWIANIGDRGIRTVDAARAWIAEKLVSSYWQKGHGLWAIERRDDGEPLGMCGLLERDSLPDVDVGYALAPRFRGNGYAREAASACLHYGRDVLGKRRILAIVSPSNAASIRVLESVGMVPDGIRVLPGEARETAVFVWGAGEAPCARDPKGEIDALVGRFFAAFSNRLGLAPVASIPSMFMPEAVVTVMRPEAPSGVDVYGVRDFVLPRAALLHDGRLTDFEEEETASRTEIVGRLAHRSSRYRKAGTLDGVRFEGAGNKQLQLVETARGWKIAALAWEDQTSGVG
jgi:RimJ/RimL family protein N-acetyltransferase